jgi:hypothetical protein
MTTENLRHRVGQRRQKRNLEHTDAAKQCAGIVVSEAARRGGRSPAFSRRTCFPRRLLLPQRIGQADISIRLKRGQSLWRHVRQLTEFKTAALELRQCGGGFSVKLLHAQFDDSPVLRQSIGGFGRQLRHASQLKKSPSLCENAGGSGREARQAVQREPPCVPHHECGCRLVGKSPHSIEPQLSSLVPSECSRYGGRKPLQAVEREPAASVRAQSLSTKREPDVGGGGERLVAGHYDDRRDVRGFIVRDLRASRRAGCDVAPRAAGAARG